MKRPVAPAIAYKYYLKWYESFLHETGQIKRSTLFYSAVTQGQCPKRPTLYAIFYLDLLQWLEVLLCVFVRCCANVSWGISCE